MAAFPIIPDIRHPACAALPELSEEEFSHMLEDIRQNGQIVEGERMPEPDNRILDGWHRYKACQKLGIQWRFRTYEGDDPWGRVASLNAQRRQTTPQQRRAFIEKALNEHPDRSTRELAETLRVPQRTVYNIRKRLETKSNDLQGTKHSAHSPSNPLQSNITPIRRVTTAAGVTRQAHNRPRTPQPIPAPQSPPIEQPPKQLDPITDMEGIISICQEHLAQLRPSSVMQRDYELIIEKARDINATWRRSKR